MDVLTVPFRYVRCPEMKMKVPSIQRPSSQLVFAGLFLVYFMVFSGIVFDLINEPPSIGQRRDQNGNIRPEVILPHRLNAQYIMEGLTAGLVYAMGAVGCLFLYFTSSHSTSGRSFYFFGIVGIICVFLSYNFLALLIRIKLPQYQR